MSRSQRRRVARLWKLAGPCLSCSDRVQQHRDGEQSLEALATGLAEHLAQQADPSWLVAEAARLTAEADGLECGANDNDAPEPASTDADTRDRRSSTSGAPAPVVAYADGCRRCQHDVWSEPGSHVAGLAARLYENVRQQRLDPDRLREEAHTLRQLAEALRTPEPA
jgi:hypothetical protein